MDRCNSSHPHARAHHRPGFRSISSFDINVSPAIDARIRSSIFPHANHARSPLPSSTIRTGKRIDLGHSYSYSDSDSKIWPKRRALVSDDERVNDAVPGLRLPAFRFVFVICLVLFLRALSGVGIRVPPGPGCEQECDDETPTTSYSQLIRGGMKDRMQVQYDYLAIDPDGHYSSYTSSENDEHRVGYWRRWGKRDFNHAMSDSNAKPEIETWTSFASRDQLATSSKTLPAH